MHIKLRPTLIDACRIGTYLVCHTREAALQLDETLKKRGASIKEPPTPMLALIFQQQLYTHGIIAHRFEKCKRLCNSYLVDEENDVKALKTYVFTLRTLLQETAFKPVIKELERNNSPLTSAADFCAYIEPLLLAQQRSPEVERDTYIALYTFIRMIREASRFLTKNEQKKTPAYEDAFLFNERIEALDDTITHVKTALLKQWTEETLVNLYTDEALTTFLQHEQIEAAYYAKYICFKYCIDEHISLAAFSEALWTAAVGELPTTMARFIGPTYAEHEAIDEAVFSMYGVHPMTLLQHAVITEEMLVHFAGILYRQQPAERRATFLQATTALVDSNRPHITRAYRQLLLQAAVAQYVEQSTAIYETMHHRQMPKIEPKKPVKQAPKPAAAEQTLRRELQQLQLAHDEAVSELQQAKQKIALLEKQIGDTMGDLFHLQTENDELTELLEQAEQAKPVSADAKKMITSMQTMLAQLQQELTEVPKEAPVATIFDELASFKIAVIGGHQNFHHQLRRHFKQELLIIPPDKHSFNLQQLLQYDVIIFTIDYANHSNYERAYDFLKKSQAKNRALILSSQPNAKRLAQEITEFLTRATV